MIRKLQSQDLEPVQQVVLNIQSQVEAPLGFFWSAQEIAEELQVGLGLGSFVNEKLMGFVLYRLVGDIVEIELLATDPAFARQGVMAQLLTELELHHATATEIWLEVHDANLKARNFYEKVGFIETALRPRYYRDGGGARMFSKKIGIKS